MMHSSYHLIFSSSTTTISSSVSVLKIPWWWFRMDSYDKTLQGTVLLKLVTGQSDFKQNIFYRVTTFKSGRKLNIILEWRLFLSQLLDERFQANVRFPSTGWWRAQYREKVCVPCFHHFWWIATKRNFQYMPSELLIAERLSQNWTSKGLHE